jgi:hypothetical protein
VLTQIAAQAAWRRFYQAQQWKEDVRRADAQPEFYYRAMDRASLALARYVRIHAREIRLNGPCSRQCCQ